jgi:glutathione S-transferase
MKLFYKAGVCSLASHIALHEAGIPFDIESVDTDAGLTASGIDFTTINPKGYVPALALDSGEVLTEGAAVLQYISEQYLYQKRGEQTPTGSLLADPIQRARLREHLNYTGSELHKAFSPLFTSTTSEENKAAARTNVAKKFDYVNHVLSDGRLFLLGTIFTVADAYLFAVSNWANFTDINIEKWPHIAAFLHRVAARPAVQVAMKAEGLIE